jgi:uncharacterized protein (DUF58 family)
VTTLVLPRVIALGSLPFVDLASSREAATDTEPRRGQGPEYLGVREYRPGDPIRQVHWRLTARHGELVVRDLEEHRVPRLALWIDSSLDEDALDEACSAAASIVTAATATGAGVRLAAATETGMSLASRSGVQALYRWLARLPTSDVPAATAIGWLGGDATRGVGTLIAVAGAGALEPGAAASLAALGRVVPRIVLVTIGPEAPLDGDPGFEVAPWLGADGLGAPMPREPAGVRA